MLSRREFSKFLGSAAMAGVPAPSWGHPNGVEGKMPAIIDASVHCDSVAARLKELGVKVVIRYFSYYQPHLKQKILHKDEADAILNAGLSLAISYQFNNDVISSFTPKKAKEAVDKCIEKIEKMAEIGQPKGSAIYFGVDHDWVDKACTEMVVKYFETLNEHAAGKFEVGIYGSGFSCRLIERRKLAKFFWIAGLSDGWSGRAQALQSNSWNMYQNILELPVNSVSVDTNVVNPKRSVIGSFHRSASSRACVLDGTIVDDRSIAIQRLLIKDSDLLAKPNGSIIRTIPASKMIILVEDHGEYSLVDVPRQIGKPKHADFVSGYCRSSALAKIPSE